MVGRISQSLNLQISALTVVQIITQYVIKLKELLPIKASGKRAKIVGTRPSNRVGNR